MKTGEREKQKIITCNTLQNKGVCVSVLCTVLVSCRQVYEWMNECESVDKWVCACVCLCDKWMSEHATKLDIQWSTAVLILSPIQTHYGFHSFQTHGDTLCHCLTMSPFFSSVTQTRTDAFSDSKWLFHCLEIYININVGSRQNCRTSYLTLAWLNTNRRKAAVETRCQFWNGSSHVGDASQCLGAS